MNSITKNSNGVITRVTTITPEQQRILNTRLSQNACRRQKDPIPAEERDKTSFNPDIDNNGGSIKNMGTGGFNKYATEKERQECENEQDGLGARTDVEVAIMMECRFDAIYDDWEDDFNQDDWDVDIQEVSELEDFLDNSFTLSIPESGIGASIDDINLLTAEEDQDLTPQELANSEPQGELSAAFELAVNPASEEESPAPAATIAAPIAANRPSPAPAFQI